MAIAAKNASILEAAESMRDDAVNYVKATANSAGHSVAEAESRVAHDIADLAHNVSGKLKTVGIDTDVMANAAKGEVSELQRILTDELRKHPTRTIGVAAALGVFIGLMLKR